MVRKDAWNDFNFFFFNLPSLDLWPRISSILEKVPWALEKKVKFIALGSILIVSVLILPTHEHGIFLHRKDSWKDLIFFEFTKARFIAQDVIYPGEGSMCT